MAPRFASSPLLRVTLVLGACLTAVAARAVGRPPAGEPEMVAPGALSTPMDELNAAFTPDGHEVYRSITAGQGRVGVIVVSRLRNGKWSEPQVASFSGRYTDFDPFIAPDGRRLFFISTRPSGAEPKAPGDFDIWVVERTAAGGWGEPTNLGAPVNTPRPEYYPSVARDGTLYFSANRDGGQGGFDVWRSRLVDGRYAEPENLGPNVNGRGGEIDNYIAPDQSFLVFAGYGRPDGLGGGDLYISYNRDGQWTSAKNLGPAVNSPARDYCPIGSPDGRFLYWTSERGFADRPFARQLTIGELRDSVSSLRNGGGNIYRVELGSLLEK